MLNCNITDIMSREYTRLRQLFTGLFEQCLGAFGSRLNTVKPETIATSQK